MVLDNVKKICFRQNIDLTILAKRLQIQRNALYISLRNKGIRLDTLQRIATALNVSVSELVQELDNNNTAAHQEQHTNGYNSFICPVCGSRLYITPEDNTTK